MLRGINHQQLFEDAEDYLRFLSILRECKEVCAYKLYAYCLMGNHVHLLMQEGKEPLDLIFKRIGGRFVYWYNLKYQRAGHLFQDRYKSEPVETDAYFLTALRYIIQNPMKAGLEEKPGTYGWSSYAAYTGKPDGLTDSEMAIEMLGGQEALLAYLAERNEDRLLDLTERKQGLTDEQAKNVIKKISGCDNIEQFQKLPGDKQNEYVKRFRNKNISIRQISRLTGVSMGIVRKY